MGRVVGGAIGSDSIGQGADAIEEKIAFVRADDRGGTGGVVDGIPDAGEEIRDGGSGEREPGIARGADAVMSDETEVLVPGELEHTAGAKKFPCLVAAMDGPAVGVLVIEEVAVTGAGMGAKVTERGLGGDKLEILAGPVGVPGAEEVVLAGAQQVLLVEVGWCVVLAGFEFPVFEDGDADTTIDHAGEINADALGDGRRGLRGVVGISIGQIAGLGALDHFHETGRPTVAAGALVGGGDAALAPEVSLENIVVVRDGDGGHVAGEFAGFQDPEIPFVEVVVVAVEVAGVVGRRGLAFVELVAGGEMDVGLVFCDVIEGERVGVPDDHRGPIDGAGFQSDIGEALAGGGGDDDLIFVHGIAADGAGPGVVGAAEVDADAVGRIGGGVPVRDFEGGGVGGDAVGVVDGHRGDLLPRAAAPGIEENLRVSCEGNRRELGGEFQGATGKRVHRADDGEAAVRLRVEGCAGAREVIEPEPRARRAVLVGVRKQAEGTEHAVGRHGGAGGGEQGVCGAEAHRS